MATKRQQDFIAEDCTIIDTLEDGQGLARVEGRVVFVPGGVPGDRVQLQVYQSGRRQFSGKILSFIAPSPHRRQPVCQHFGTCGGCKWQQINYDAQLHYKQKQVTDALQRIGKIENPQVLPIIGAHSELHYRNKLEFTFSPRRWKSREEFGQDAGIDNRVLGFHAPGIYDKIIPIETCYLQDERVNAVRNEALRYAREHNFSFYDVKQLSGFLRTLVFRTSQATGEMMVILCVAEDRPDLVTQLFTHLSAAFPFITSLVWMLNTKMNDSYNDLEPRVWHGPGHITEKLGQYQFQVSPTSFFQTNTTQAQKLYDVVRQCVGSRVHTLYDLYCGAGSIGIYLSALAERIVGVEYAASAVQDAHHNVALNNLAGFTFHAGDMAKILTPAFVAQNGTPDVVVTDPPRAGMDPKVTQRLIEVAPPRIVYVSCNAATQARDLLLLKAHYHIRTIQPVDMFPQTAHVENVALLEKM